MTGKKNRTNSQAQTAAGFFLSKKTMVIAKRRSEIRMAISTRSVRFMFSFEDYSAVARSPQFECFQSRYSL
jgi:diketogulonate reductase-like aldo/keto reductase